MPSLKKLAARDEEVRGPSSGRRKRKPGSCCGSIPGVGPVTTEVVLSELADPKRFRSAKCAVAYAGMAPGQRESAGKRKELHIERTGSKLLRWMLVESAWQLVRHTARWRVTFERLSAPHRPEEGDRRHRPKAC